MMENFPSPGASCGSPFSDVTSGSPSQYSDAFEPVSPDYNIDTLRADFTAAGPSSSPSDLAAEDSVPEEDSQAVLADYRFYQTLPVGSAGATQSHVQYLLTKHRTGRMSLPTKNSTARDPNSLTPYSDFAKSKKPGKEGAIKRPLNNFMCFSKIERGQLMAGQPELHNARISEHLGEVWKQCPTELKDQYREMAEWLKELHRQEHPEYKYRPRKRKTPAGSTSASSSPAAAAAAASADGPNKSAKRVRKPATTKPRSRSRKNTGQAHVVPASNIADRPLTPDTNEPLYADVTHVLDNRQCYVLDVKPSLSDLQRLAADIKPSLNDLQRISPDIKPVVGEFRPDGNLALYAVWQERSEPDLGSAGSLAEQPAAEVRIDDVISCEEPKDDLEVFGQLPQLPLPTLGSLDDLNMCDQFGFEVGSENLVEGPQLQDALEYEGDLKLDELYGNGMWSM